MFFIFIGKQRYEGDPDPPGYFEDHAWPAHEAVRDHALAQLPDLVVLPVASDADNDVAAETLAARLAELCEQTD